MKYKKIPNTDFKVSKLSVGTWQFGQGLDWGESSLTELLELVSCAYEAGVNFFDTAPVYNEGQSEEILGKALGAKRKDVFISTKVLTNKFNYQNIKDSLVRSLRRLDTDYVDFFQIHWPKDSMSRKDCEDIFTSFMKLKKEGFVRVAGLSNFRAKHLEGFSRDALSFFSFNQVPCNLLWRYYDVDGTTKLCESNHISLFAYSPLAQGLLTGRFKRNESFKSRARSQNILFKDPAYSKSLKVIEKVEDIARNHNCSPAQVALSWVMDKLEIATSIVGLRRTEHLKDGLASLDVKLSQAELKLLNEESLRFQEELDPGLRAMWKFANK